MRSCLGDASPCPRFTWVLGSLRAHPLPSSAAQTAAGGSWEEHKDLWTGRGMGEQPAASQVLLAPQVQAFPGLCSQLHCGALPCSVGAPSPALCWQPSPAIPPLQVQKEFPTMDRTHLRDACAASSYTLALLLQGYKFNHMTWLNIHFVPQVGKCPAAASFHAS